MTDRHEGSVAVDSHAPLSFGGTVKTVLETPQDDACPGDARGGPQPARPPRADRGDHAPHREPGHQVRLLPAGLDHGPRDGQGRRLLVLPAGRREAATSSSTAPPPTSSPTAPATTSASAPRSPSSPPSPTSTPSPSCRGTRASRACTATATTPRPASCWTPTRARTSSASCAEFERELGYSFLIGIEPEMMWLQARARTARRPRARRSPTATTSTSSRSSVRCCSTWSSTARRSGLDMSYGDHEDAPGQLELNFRFDRPVRTADNITTYRQVCAAVGPQARPAADLHAQAVHGRLGQRPPPPLHADRRRGQQRLPRPRRPGAALGHRPATSWAACSTTSAR